MAQAASPLLDDRLRGYGLLILPVAASLAQFAAIEIDGGGSDLLNIGANQPAGDRALDPLDQGIRKPLPQFVGRRRRRVQHPGNTPDRPGPSGHVVDAAPSVNLGELRDRQPIAKRNCALEDRPQPPADLLDQRQGFRNRKAQHRVLAVGMIDFGDQLDRLEPRIHQVIPRRDRPRVRSLGENLDRWAKSERRTRLRELLRTRDKVDPDTVIMSPEAARKRGLTSTVTFPRGNLAPDGCVIKSTAIDPSVVDKDGVYRKTGPAKVFIRERDAIKAIKGEGERKVAPGDVLVLCCRGPLGSGMEETYQVTSALKHLKWGKQVAVITDARFSGVSTGACIGHVSPEALAGGPLGKLRDGDLVRIVIDRNKLEGTVDLVGGAAGDHGPEWGAAELLRRAPRPDLEPDPAL
ncbi:MAG: dihydroxy-acid dehydratase, partial [Hyphomicrobium sp.]|nr:dihydroxy-acid dehydratase [Hyphomicrobium sp.]